MAICSALHDYQDGATTLRAFTNPGAADPENGLQYNALADSRSWQGMQNFLSEVFS